MYMDQAKPVLFVPVSTGMASSTAAVSENGVSLYHGTVRISTNWRAIPPLSRMQGPDVPMKSTISRCNKNGLIRTV